MARQQPLPGKQRFLPGILLLVLHLFLLFSLALVASPDFSIRLRLPFLRYSLALPCAAPQTKELELLEVVADIGRAVADEAVEIAAAEGQDLAAGDAQGSLAVTEHSSEDVPVGEVAVEVKIPLQTIGTLPATWTVAEILPSSSSTLAMVLLSQP